MACCGSCSRGPIRFEGHKQVTEFSFMVIWWIVTRVPMRKQWSSFTSCPSFQEMSSVRVIGSAVFLCGCHSLCIIRWGGFKLVNKLMNQRFDLKYCIRCSKCLLAATYLLKPFPKWTLLTNKIDRCCLKRDRCTLRLNDKKSLCIMYCYYCYIGSSRFITWFQTVEGADCIISGW